MMRDVGNWIVVTNTGKRPIPKFWKLPKNKNAPFILGGTPEGGHGRWWWFCQGKGSKAWEGRRLKAPVSVWLGLGGLTKVKWRSDPSSVSP